MTTTTTRRTSRFLDNEPLFKISRSSLQRWVDRQNKATASRWNSSSDLRQYRKKGCPLVRSMLLILETLRRYESRQRTPETSNSIAIINAIERAEEIMLIDESFSEEINKHSFFFFHINGESSKASNSHERKGLRDLFVLKNLILWWHEVRNISCYNVSPISSRINPVANSFLLYIQGVRKKDCRLRYSPIW